jgi:hypothetical protein
MQRDSNAGCNCRALSDEKDREQIAPGRLQNLEGDGIIGTRLREAAITPCRNEGACNQREIAVARTMRSHPQELHYYRFQRVLSRESILRGQ